MNEGLNTWQLKHALSTNNLTREYFNGVYPSDYLKTLSKKPDLIIVNTDPSSKPGDHWLLFFNGGKGILEMFDSLGRDPGYYNSDINSFIARYSDSVEFINHRLQPKDSALCGLYCLYYAHFRCKGKSMNATLASMDSPDLIKCCVPIIFEIPGIISECQSCKML